MNGRFTDHQTQSQSAFIQVTSTVHSRIVLQLQLFIPGWLSLWMCDSRSRLSHILRIQEIIDCPWCHAYKGNPIMSGWSHLSTAN